MIRFEIVDTCTLPTLDANAGPVELWYPVIADSPYQRVLDLSIDAPWDWRISRDAIHGNTILHSRFDSGQDAESVIALRYVVERISVQHALDSRDVRPLATPKIFERWLMAEQFVDVDDRTRALAANVVGEETNPLTQARRIFGSMRYDAEQQSWKGSTGHALVCSVGNCNDIHALFLSLCRSVGIPARLVLGQALEQAAPGQENCELCGYHCWAEFFVAGLGWLPADASCACKYGKHTLFGDLETNHIAWSVGRDLELVPRQQGAPLLFFAGPYLERDGRPATGLRRHVRFNEIQAEV